MAAMYSLFLGFLLAALCRGNVDGGSVVGSLKPRVAHTFLLDQESMQRNQGLVARLNCLLISGNKTNSLRSNKSDCLSEIIDNSLRLAQPRPFFWDNTSSTSLQLLNLSPAKFLTIAVGCRTFVSKILSDEFFASFFAEKKEEPRHGLSGIRGNRSGMEDKRNLIIVIASNELGVKEATGHNDGPRVEQYLRYTNLGPGYDWCAAFVSWVYGQAGLVQPRNPWSPALFPKARSYKDEGKIQKADLFGIYSAKLKRINHVGLIKEKQGSYILTIEGNSNNRVESRRRHQKTIHSYADWVD